MRYDVELAVGTGKLRSVGRPRLFALEEAGWIKALKLSGYAPHRYRKPAALQDVLFPFLAGTGG